MEIEEGGFNPNKIRDWGTAMTVRNIFCILFKSNLRISHVRLKICVPTPAESLRTSFLYFQKKLKCSWVFKIICKLVVSVVCEKFYLWKYSIFKILNIATYLIKKILKSVINVDWYFGELIFSLHKVLKSMTIFV